MRSRFFVIAGERAGAGSGDRLRARSARTRRAFTLIELIAVLVILGLVAAAVGIASGGGSASARQHRALTELAGLVGLARAEAMKLSNERAAEISAIDGTLGVRVGERIRSWPDAGLVIAARGRTVAEAVPREVEQIEVVFDGLGRTRDRVIVFDGRDAGGRMWALAFDPVSGALRLEDVGAR